MLERAPRHVSQANPAERAIRTLEEQVKVLHLDFEKRSGTELLANSCSWPWLTRHAGWLDARLRVKTNGATPYQDAYDSTYSSELLPFGELVWFRIPLPHTRRTNQNRAIYRSGSIGRRPCTHHRHWERSKDCTNCPQTSFESTC